MGIFSGSFTAETGTVTIEVDGSTIISGSGTFRVIDIGKLEFSNELPQKDEDNPTSVAMKQGGLEITVHDTLTSGNSFYSYLNELEVGEQLNCKLIVNGLETLLAIDVFGFSYDARTEHTTLKFKPRYAFPTDGSITYGNIEMPIDDFYVGATGGYDIATSVSTGSIISAYGLYNVVEDYLKYIYGSGYTTYVRSADRSIGNVPTGRILQDDATFGAPPAHNDVQVLVPYTATAGILANISRYAAMEGSIFGSAFNINYYINRLDTGSDATATFRPEINYNFVEELDLDRKKSFLKYVRVRAYGGAYVSASGVVYASADNTTVTGITLNSLGNQQLTVDFSTLSMFPARYVTSLGSITDAFVGNSSLWVDAVSNGVRAYSKALGGDGSRRIKFKFRNALSLKPYQCFTLSSGAPAVFRASGASSVVYRPSRLYYDFKGDYVEGEAYAIAAV